MTDEFYMKEALRLAKIAYKRGEVPVGAVIIKDNKIVSKAYNLRETKNKISKHAEIVAIEKASKRLKTLKLDGCTIYSTLEPCPMCSYAIIDSHIDRLVYGAPDIKRGAITILDIFSKNLGKKVEICGNILKKEAETLLKGFFKNLR